MREKQSDLIGKVVTNCEPKTAIGLGILIWDGKIEQMSLKT